MTTNRDYGAYVTISQELADYLVLDIGIPHRRDRICEQVIREMREHKCSPTVISEICLNPLHHLLHVKTGDELTYFNLVDKLHIHFTEISDTKKDITIWNTNHLPYLGVSKELSDFLRMDADAVYPRTVVFKRLYAYMCEYECNEAHGSKIYPNMPLSKLLRLDDHDKITHFNLWDKLKIHLTEKTVT
jgi:hypothetical protein